jgi:hypothetical protein
MLDLQLQFKHNMKQAFSSVSCPICETPFERLPIEYDEDGSGCVVLEVRPCADSACGKMLCACCDQFHCDGCGQTFCADHLVSVPDGTDRPLHCCPACAAECEFLEMPPRIPPAPETRPIFPAEAA